MPNIFRKGDIATTDPYTRRVLEQAGNVSFTPSEQKRLTRLAGQRVDTRVTGATAAAVERGRRSQIKDVVQGAARRTGRLAGQRGNAPFQLPSVEEIGQMPLSQLVSTAQSYLQSKGITPVQVNLPEAFNAQDLIKPTEEITVPSPAEGQAERTQTLEEQIKSLYEAGLKQVQESRLAELKKMREEEAAAGIPEMERQLRDIRTQIAARIGGLKRGIAEIGAQPIPTPLIRGQQAQLRAKELAEISALQAQEAALTGNIKTARDAVNRALELEFLPLQARISFLDDFIRANINILTERERVKLEAQKEAEKRALAEEKAKREQNYNLLLAVAQAGGDTSAVDLNADPVENLRKPEIAAALKRKTGLSPFTIQQQFSNERALIKDFNADKRVKDFREINQRFNILERAQEEALQTGNLVAVDQAIISTFNKITDPTSVVRESEYARTAEDLKLINRLRGKVEKFMRGGAGLTQDDREAIVRLASQFREVARQKAMQAKNEIMEQAQAFGLTPVLGTDISAESTSILSGIKTDLSGTKTDDEAQIILDEILKQPKEKALIPEIGKQFKAAGQLIFDLFK